MPGITAKERDWEQVHDGLSRWLRRCWPDAGDLEIGPLEVSGTNGFSNETVFFDAHLPQGPDPHVRSLVARLAPFGGGLFPEYDLEAQWRIQATIGRHGIPAAAQIGFEADPSWLGSPFLVMEKVSGRVATDHPLYCLEGWLRDASATRQLVVCESAIEAMASVHRLDWQATGLSSVARPGGIGLTGELAWWEAYLKWVSSGSTVPPLEQALAWCIARQPASEPAPALLWGDARFANMIFGSDDRPSALLDWEMASIGPPEVDLGWFTATRTQSRELAGGLPDPELPGFLSREETIQHYEEALGRKVGDLRWYEVFAMVRWGICIASIHRILRGLGVTDHFIFESPLMPEWAVALMHE